MTAELSIGVGTNTPKRAAPNGQGPEATQPPPSAMPPPAQPGLAVVETRYWTAERAERAIAYACKALVPIAGPDMRASELELDLAGGPLAAVLHQVMPLPSEESAPLPVNLAILAVVLGFMVLVRLPAIMAAVDKARKPKAVAADAAPTMPGFEARPQDPAPAAAAGDPERRPGGWDTQPQVVGTGRVGR